MALVAEVMLPRFPPAGSAPVRATRWLASDVPPERVQSWPLLVPIPVGWHEVSDSEAARIQHAPGRLRGFTIAAPPSTPASEVAALLSSPPDPSRRQPSRLPRPPRTPRQPRSARRARTVRASRIFREPRPARPPRKPRTPRPPRAARRPRPPRPRAYQTTQDPGVCKGPACNCWTPGGCIGSWYLKLLPDFKGSQCYRGPCFSYEACATDKCTLHPTCAINTILAFWARQFRAVVAGQGIQLAGEAVGEVRRIVSRARRVIPATVTEIISGPVPAPPAGVTDGCAPGTVWTVGLTGYHCTPIAWGLPRATRAELIAAGILTDLPPV